MNESRYGQLLSDAADEVMRMVGADPEYIAAGHSFFTVETNIKYLHETHAGERISVATSFLEAAGKKLRLHHEITNDNGVHLATGEQLLIHVSLTTRRACDPLPQVAANLAALATAHSHQPHLNA